LELRHGRPFNPDVGVTPRDFFLVLLFFCAGEAAGVNAADIDTACDGDFTVDNKNFPVITMGRLLSQKPPP